jgi:predicted transcriptional regulator
LLQILEKSNLFCLTYPQKKIYSNSLLTTFDYLNMKTITTTNSIRRKVTPLSIKLDSDKKDQLAWIAEKKERSVHFLLLQAVSEYIENEKKRLEFYEDGRKALEHYKASGLHTTHEEMIAWANSLGTANELPQPKCHK